MGSPLFIIHFRYDLPYDALNRLTNTVDAAGWDRLKAELRAAVAEVRETVQKHAAEAPDSAMFAIGAVAHTVYHLGALRKIVAVLRQK